jgi:hypothetical protein
MRSTIVNTIKSTRSRKKKFLEQFSYTLILKSFKDE